MALYALILSEFANTWKGEKREKEGVSCGWLLLIVRVIVYDRSHSGGKRASLVPTRISKNACGWVLFTRRSIVSHANQPFEVKPHWLTLLVLYVNALGCNTWWAETTLIQYVVPNDALFSFASYPFWSSGNQWPFFFPAVEKQKILFSPKRQFSLFIV